MSDKTDRPPFRELMTIMENIGYEVISISAEDIGALNLGAINLRIIPKAWLSDSAFNYFPSVKAGGAA